MTLKKVREKTGMTQDEIAKLIEIPVRTYQRIEKENTCRLETAYSISQVLGKSIEEIFFK